MYKVDPNGCTLSLVLCTVALGINAFAQTASPVATTPAITDIGPNHRVWQWQVPETLPDGRVALHSHRFN